MKFLITLLFISSSFGFSLFGFGSKDKEIDPRTIKSHEKRIEWIKEHNPGLFNEIERGNKVFEKENEDAWEEYLEMAKIPYDPNGEEKKRAQNIKELKEAQAKKNKLIEEKMKKGYKFINGELVGLEEQEKLKKSEELKKIELQRVVDFYEEMDMKLPKDAVKVKDE